MTTTLFKLGIVPLHSGGYSDFKIDCDALTDEDMRCLAYLIWQRVGSFNPAIGIPNGGLRLAWALNSA